MKTMLNEDEVIACIIALEYRAQTEAGHSQSPDLFSAQDTLDWELAQKLRRKIGFLGSPKGGCLLKEKSL